MGFFERSDMPQPEAFPLFGVRHILLLLVLAACIIAGLLLIRRLKPPQAQRVLYVQQSLFLCLSSAILFGCI